jgi:hypothetical protein
MSQATARDWRANFFPVGIAHSIVGGSAWEPTPWRAVQRAAWAALNKTETTAWTCRHRRAAVVVAAVVDVCRALR